MSEEENIETGAVPESPNPIVEPSVEVAVEVPAEIPPVVEPTIPLHTDTPTLMESFESERPAEPTPQPTETPEPIIEPPPEPVHYDFQLPEGMVDDADTISRYTEVLGEHRVPPEVGQELIEMHAAALQRHASHLAQEQHRVFAETRAGWRNDVMADEELGGSGHQTTMAAISRMRDLFVPENDRTAFGDFLRVTGAGDHPAFLRLLNRVAKLFDEARPAPVPAPAPQPSQGRRGIIYDHPTSKISP